MPVRSLILKSALILTLASLLGCQSLPQSAKTDHSRPLSTEASAAEPIPASQTAAPLETKASSSTETTTAAAEPPSFKQAAPPAPPTDVWERMRRGFSWSIPVNAQIEREFKWFAARSEYLDRIQQRAEPYLFFIMEEIEKRGMPAELALLPVVESAFRPFAYSPGRAAGLWQFIPSTGRHYGLKQNWWYDGRRDVVASTQAALDYLKRLNELFNGDWELALAAYNAGEGNVQRAIRKNKRKGKPTDFWSLKLPRETRSYVPRLLALARLFGEPIKHGIQLKPIANKPHFSSVDIQSQLDLALAAEMAALSMEELYMLNPGFNRWATDPQGPHRLQLPIDKVEPFMQKLAALDSSKRLRWTRYKIRQGDNLGTIARKHGTTIGLLQQINKLRGSRIRAGKHLLIPISTKKLTHYSLSAQQRKVKAKSVTRKGTRLTYEVQPGDTLWDISRNYKVNHRKLAGWNAMAPRDTLHPGQELLIWINTPAEDNKKPQTALLPVNLNTGPANTQSTLSYRVRKGDSLYRIAQRFKVSVADLKKWNSLSGKYLQPGQKLKLYVDVTQQAL